MGNANNKYTIEIEAEFKRIRKQLADLQKDQERINKLNEKSTSKADKEKIKREIRDDRFQKIKQKEEEKHHKKIDNLLKKRHNEANKQFKKEQAEYKKFGMNANNFRLSNARFPGAKQDRFGRATGGAVTLSGMRGAVGQLGRWGGSILGGLTGFLIGGATAGYSRYMEYGSALGNAIGYGRNSGVSTKAGIRGAKGGRLGYSLIDTANQVGSMARNTGVVGPRELQQGMRSTGLDQGELGSIYGTIRQAGTTFDNPQGNGQGMTRANSPGGKEFQKMIALGMASGLERGRLPEFFQGVSQLVQEQGGRSAGNIDVTTFSKQLAMLGRSGNSGFQGARGAAVLSKLSQGIVNPGGGEYGQVFMRQAMGFGKPGGDTTYYQAEKMREQGIKDPQNISRMIGETVAQHGSGEEGALHLRELTGVSLEQAEELFKIYNSNQSTNDKLADMQKIADESKSLEEQSLDQMKGIGGQVRRLAGRTDIMIGVGARAAKAIEAVEDWQTKLLFWLMDIATKVGEIAQAVLAWLSDSPGANAQKAVEDIRARQQRFYQSSMDPVQRAQYSEELQRQMRESRKKMLGDTNIINSGEMSPELAKSAYDTVFEKVANAYGTNAVTPKEKSDARARARLAMGAPDEIKGQIGKELARNIMGGAGEDSLEQAINQVSNGIIKKLKKTDPTMSQPSTLSAAPGGISVAQTVYVQSPSPNPGGRPNKKSTKTTITNQSPKSTGQ